MYTFIALFLMNDIEATTDAPCIFCPSRILDVEKCIWICFPTVVTPCQVRKDLSNLVDESRDEILRKGGRL
jgi:hypothetical protein